MLRGRRSGEDLDREDGKGDVFRLAKQLVNKNRDVMGASCVKNNDEKIVFEEDKHLKVWRAHYDKISNVTKRENENKIK